MRHISASLQKDAVTEGMSMISHHHQPIGSYSSAQASGSRSSKQDLSQEQSQGALFPAFLKKVRMRMDASYPLFSPLGPGSREWLTNCLGSTS